MPADKIQKTAAIFGVSVGYLFGECSQENEEAKLLKELIFEQQKQLNEITKQLEKLNKTIKTCQKTCKSKSNNFLYTEYQFIVILFLVLGDCGSSPQ